MALSSSTLDHYPRKDVAGSVKELPSGKEAYEIQFWDSTAMKSGCNQAVLVMNPAYSSDSDLERHKGTTTKSSMGSVLQYNIKSWLVLSLQPLTHLLIESLDNTEQLTRPICQHISRLQGIGSIFISDVSAGSASFRY